MNANKHESKAPCSIRVYLCLSVAVFLPVLTGCQSLGRTPAWVANPKAVYPESAYLVSVGAGDTRRAAENAAAANLSRIFEAHIESDERLLDQVHERGKHVERTTTFTADINILSAQTLYNVQHAEAWQDRNGRYHAVAYLDRGETGGIYRGKINEQTTRVEFLLGHAEQTDGLLKKYALLRAANQHAAENLRLLRQLKVIHPRAVASATPAYSTNELRKALADTAQQIRVKIRIAGDDERRMVSCLEELITRYGFVVGQPAVLEVDGRVSVTDTRQRAFGIVFVRYELALQIKDAGGSVLATLNNKGREGHVSLAEARVRSFRTLENAINTSGAQHFDHYFDSLIELP